MSIAPPMRNVKAAFIVEFEDGDGETKRMIYGFDPYRPISLTAEHEYEGGSLHWMQRESMLTGIHLKIEGYSGSPRMYDGPMPKANPEEITEKKAITDGTEDIIEGELIDD